jgi:hypothetical protein
VAQNTISYWGKEATMKFIATLILLSGFAFATPAVNGNENAVFASGVWDESHEGVSLICMHVTTADGTNLLCGLCWHL